MVLVQKWPFFKVCFYRQYRLGKFLLPYSRTKNVFLSYRHKNFSNSKNWDISKGVNPWLWSKNGHFSNFFFLGLIGQKNVFYGFLERKNVFLSYKNKNFNTSKKWHFSKGVNPWFWSKNGHFSTFVFFRQYRQGKCPLRYARTRKRLSKL